MSIFSKLILKYTYRSVYGNKAVINVSEDKVEVVIGNRKVIHNKENNIKIEETFFEGNKVRVVRYNRSGGIKSEEVYIDGEKVEEKFSENGKVINLEIAESGLEIFNSTYFKNGIEVKETTYKYHDEKEDAKYDITIQEAEEENIKSIVKNKEGNVVLDAKKHILKDGRVTLYKENDMEIQIEYYGDRRTIKTYSRHWEEPIFEESPKDKKNAKSSKEKAVKKQIGTKIRKEVIKYNEKGQMTYLETERETINKEYDKEGNLKKQYTIIDGERGKEIVGKIITEDKDIKIINNSTLPDDEIVRINERIDRIEYNYENNLIMMYDFIDSKEDITLVEEFYLINSKLELEKREFDRTENSVNYRIQESYRGNKLYGTRFINKASKIELYCEGSKRFVKGFNGVEKEVTDEEFEIYKMADELNKG